MLLGWALCDDAAIPAVVDAFSFPTAFQLPANRRSTLITRSRVSDRLSLEPLSRHTGSSSLGNDQEKQHRSQIYSRTQLQAKTPFFAQTEVEKSAAKTTSKKPVQETVQETEEEDDEASDADRLLSTINESTQAGRYAEAKEAWLEYLNMYPFVSSYTAFAKWAELEAKNTPLARSIYENMLIDLNPLDVKQPWVFREWASFEERQGEYERAKIIYNQLEEMAAEAKRKSFLMDPLELSLRDDDTKEKPSSGFVAASGDLQSFGPTSGEDFVAQPRPPRTPPPRNEFLRDLGPSEKANGLASMKSKDTKQTAAKKQEGGFFGFGAKEVKQKETKSDIKNTKENNLVAPLGTAALLSAISLGVLMDVFPEVPLGPNNPATPVVSAVENRLARMAQDAKDKVSSALTDEERRELANSLQEEARAKLAMIKDKVPIGMVNYDSQESTFDMNSFIDSNKATTDPSKVSLLTPYRPSDADIDKFMTNRPQSPSKPATPVDAPAKSAAKERTPMRINAAKDNVDEVKSAALAQLGKLKKKIPASFVGSAISETAWEESQRTYIAGALSGIDSKLAELYGQMDSISSVERNERAIALAKEALELAQQAMQSATAGPQTVIPTTTALAQPASPQVSQVGAQMNNLVPQDDQRTLLEVNAPSQAKITGEKDEEATQEDTTKIVAASIKVGEQSSVSDQAPPIAAPTPPAPGENLGVTHSLSETRTAVDESKTGPKSTDETISSSPQAILKSETYSTVTQNLDTRTTVESVAAESLKMTATATVPDSKPDGTVPGGIKAADPKAKEQLLQKESLAAPMIVDSSGTRTNGEAQVPQALTGELGASKSPVDIVSTEKQVASSNAQPEDSTMVMGAKKEVTSGPGMNTIAASGETKVTGQAPPNLAKSEPLEQINPSMKAPATAEPNDLGTGKVSLAISEKQVNAKPSGNPSTTPVSSEPQIQNSQETEVASQPPAESSPAPPNRAESTDNEKMLAMAKEVLELARLSVKASKENEALSLDRGQAIGEATGAPQRAIESSQPQVQERRDGEKTTAPKAPPGNVVASSSNFETGDAKQAPIKENPPPAALELTPLARAPVESNIVDGATVGSKGAEQRPQDAPVPVARSVDDIDDAIAIWLTGPIV